jgi:hypothetical protein
VDIWLYLLYSVIPATNFYNLLFSVIASYRPDIDLYHSSYPYSSTHL